MNPASRNPLRNLVLSFSLLFWLCSSCAAPEEPLLALVDGAPITLDDVRHTPEFADYLDQNTKQRLGGAVTPDQIEKDPAFSDVLDRFIEDRVFLKIALVKGLQLQADSVRKVMGQEVRRLFPPPKDFRKWLADHGLTEDDYRRHVEAGMRRDQILRLYLTPSADEVRKYCEGNVAYFLDQFVTTLSMKPSEFSCTNPLVQDILRKQLYTLNIQNPSLVKVQMDTLMGYAKIERLPGGRPTSG